MGRRKSRRSWETRATARRRRARQMAPARSTSCGKIRYTSRAAAETAAELKATKEHYPDELRVYWHRKCRGFHITSEPKRAE